MVEEPPMFEVIVTPSFLADLETCVRYVGENLGSPLAAKRMYLGIRRKVEGLKTLPTAASSYISSVTGSKRYRISYGKYDIHYSVDEGNRKVVVLGIKHQLQRG